MEEPLENPKLEVKQVIVYRRDKGVLMGTWKFAKRGANFGLVEA